MNQVVLLSDDSEIGRSIVFEFHNYYSSTNRPADKFGRRFFEDEWKESDWNEFYVPLCTYVYEAWHD
ncbi:MAG: hypothetical protein LBC89_06105 [Bacteroidales bacterium]|jgi:hypothetical protein|nr:hypothetical protein [Bacteroidales bacterium]